MSAYFVTSTGTDIGKTFVTAGLIRYLRGSGQPIDALKPVVSGYDSSVVETSDPAVLLGALGKPVSAEEIERIAPWRFRAPLAPDLAAAIRPPSVPAGTARLRLTFTAQHPDDAIERLADIVREQIMAH